MVIVWWVEVSVGMDQYGAEEMRRNVDPQNGPFRLQQVNAMCTFDMLQHIRTH